MCQYEKKNCPPCGTTFECKPANITQCQCYGVVINEELKVYLEQHYNDCLCKSCLEYLSVEFFGVILLAAAMKAFAANVNGLIK